MEESPLIKVWTTTVKNAANESSRHEPNYFLRNPGTLLSSSDVISFQTGTGDDIFASILPSLESARSEILFVTCFWARSSSLNRLCRSLCALSDRVVRNREARVRVRIGFSSLSLFQKLFQTSNLAGRAYPSEEWVTKLGLPPPDRLQGLDLQIKSIFVRPFSVMHPKFIIIDRARVWLPSCNVSWEAWFEGCVGLTGSVIAQFVRFWEQFWQTPGDGFELKHVSAVAVESTPDEGVGDCHGSVENKMSFHDLGQQTFTVFLPSPHHVNPRFRPFPCQRAAIAPPTPLNIFILKLLATATRSIYIQTPNLTSPPVLSATLKALRRGVHVHIVTSEKLMILEQLATAGTTGARCVKQLIRHYKRLSNRDRTSDPDNYEDIEAQTTPGKLKVDFYQPRKANQNSQGEPVQSHLKLTVVDDEWLVLGSGNMDRASWYTSQELGLAFYNAEMTVRVMELLESALIGRKKEVFA